MEEEEMQKLNPFFTIWFSTRKTIRYVLDNKDLKYSLTIAAVAGIPNTIGAIGEWEKNFDIPLLLILIGVILLGPIFGIIGIAIGAAIYTMVGKWFGGTGKFKEMLQAVGVNMIPIIWMTPYYIIAAFIARSGFADMTTGPVTAGAIGWSILSFFIMIAFGIWMIVIQSKGIGEVHQFSSWKGFATLIIPSIIIGIIVFIITFIVIFSIMTG